MLLSKNQERRLPKSIDLIIEDLKNEAIKSDHRYKHAACILYKGQVICKGHNTRLIKSKTSRHAERSCLRKIPKHIPRDELIMLVIRVNKTGNLCNSLPCDSCRDGIEIAGIETVFHS